MHLSHEQRIRYGRHTQLPEVGEEGQVKLLQSRVLLVGAGGLGSPVALYLAAAGVGTLGIVDNDSVSLSNLQRQVIHSTVGKLKAPSVTEAIQRLTPDVSVIEYIGRLDHSTVDRYFDANWDIIVDATDNLETRYLINEACTKRKLPWVHGAVSTYEGMVTKFVPGSYCYRCLYPEINPTHGPRARGSGGVLGVVPGVIGTIQATEVLKHILRIGEPLEGRMLIFDAKGMSFKEYKLNPTTTNCPVCSMDSHEG